MPIGKQSKKPTARGTRSTRTKNKKNAKPTAGARTRRAKMQEQLRASSVAPPPSAPPAPPSTPADLREALRGEGTRPPTTGARSTPEQELARIRESAQRLGVKVDEQAALQWLTQMAVQDKQEIMVDAKNFVYGAKIAIMDFSPQDLAYFRRVGKIVAIEDKPGVIETALALSGSAAQSKIQANPGDADFFQRVNIKAPTRQEAVKILAEAMRARGLATLRGPDHLLLSVKFGTHPADVMHNGVQMKKGWAMTWYPKELEAGQFEVELADGTKQVVLWEDAMADPQWCKLDWIVADSQRGQLANVSNLLDVTWEAPDGKLTPLDGVIDPYFQEVYLDAASVPVFGKIVREIDDNAVAEYVKGLEGEVYKYLVKHQNYGKVAKRSYNVFRMTNRYMEAAFIRELFDEPTTALYRVWALFETLADAAAPDSQLDRVALLKQYDALIEQVIRSTEGEKELQIVRALMRARDEALGLEPMVESLDANFEAPREDVIEILNTYFHDRLYGFAPIAAYLEEVRTRKDE